MYGLPPSAGTQAYPSYSIYWSKTSQITVSYLNINCLLWTWEINIGRVILLSVTWNVHYARFQVLTAVAVNSTVFRDMKPCSLVRICVSENFLPPSSTLLLVFCSVCTSNLKMEAVGSSVSKLQRDYSSTYPWRWYLSCPLCWFLAQTFVCNSNNLFWVWGTGQLSCSLCWG